MIRTQSVTWRRCMLSALTLASATGAVLSCSNDVTPPDESGTFYGPVATVGGGTGRAYVILDRAGVPTDLGVALTEAALTGLPAATAEYVFVLPSQASSTAFKHAVINWQPMGHPPAMVYTVPHFDVHFYTITTEQRQAILLGTTELAAKMARRPADEFIPSGYVQGMASAQMGNHWNDPSEPQYSGGPFTKTMIYGTYDGAVIFTEPMISKAYLETKPARVVTPIKLPAQYSARGYQATSYTVAFDAGSKEYLVALSGLVLR
jgi:hypothetical protein